MLNGIMSFSEAAEKYNLDSSTLRKAVVAGKLLENVDCVKSGSTWLVTEEALEREYGSNEEKTIGIKIKQMIKKEEMYLREKTNIKTIYLKYNFKYDDLIKDKFIINILKEVDDIEIDINLEISSLNYIFKEDVISDIKKIYERADLRKNIINWFEEYKQSDIEITRYEVYD